MPSKLTDRDICDAADLLRVTPAHVLAVDEVESRGSGFDSKGRVVILFERHVFWRNTKSAEKHNWRLKFPAICNPSPGGYNIGGSQYDRFSFAFKLDPQAAMKACSWGRYQILGENHEICGYPTVDAFVDAMKKGEREQLLAFVAFCRAGNLDAYLRRGDWQRFAERYNGPAYRRNRYDAKLRAAFKKHAAKTFDCSSPAEPSGGPATLTPIIPPVTCNDDAPAHDPGRPSGFFSLFRRFFSW